MRREEVLKEYARMEKKLLEAAKMLERTSMEEKEAVRKAQACLPRELARLARVREGRLAKRALLRKLLAKWLAACRRGKGILASLPKGKLAKIASLFSLFGR